MEGDLGDMGGYGKKRSVLIATLPPDGWGGVTTMTKVLYSYLEATGRYHPSLIYNTFGYKDPGNVSAWRMLLGRWKVLGRPEVYYGMRGLRTGRRFPAVELLHHLGNLREWLRHSRDFEILQVVSGSNHCGLAFAVGGRRFVCWVATTMDEDKLGRTEAWPLWRLALDRASRPFLRALEGYIYHRSRMILTLSRYTASLISQRYGISAEKIVVLPLPIDTDRFRPVEKRGQGDPAILFIGRINDRRKNVILLQRAFARVRRRIPGARLILAGDEPDVKLGEQVRALALDGTVEFPGPLPHEQTVSYYQRASVFAIPSHQEGLCIAGLEAMACGLPVVSTRCGGPEDFVRDGVNGYLVGCGDDLALAERLTLLLGDENLRQKMGCAARLQMEQSFSFSRLAPTFERVYREVWPEFFDAEVQYPAESTGCVG